MLINWFPADIVSPPGRLGLTHLPGVDGKLDADLDALQQAGVTRLLCLVEPHEFSRRKPESIEQRRQAVESRGITFMHHPIVDFDAPRLSDAQPTIAALDKGIKAGDHTIIHCWAGLGRAGTMAACLLIHNGMQAADAIATVRSVRNGAIQSARQEQFIAAFESG